MRGAHVILDLLDSLSCPVLSSALWLACSSSIGKGRTLFLKMPYPGWNEQFRDFFVPCSFPHPLCFQARFLDNFPASYYNSQLYRCSYFQVEPHFLFLCHISSLTFPWCVIFSIVVIFKHLPTWYIYHTSRGSCLSLTLYQNWNKDIKLTWFHSNTVETLLDTFPTPGISIYHCFWMSYLGLFLAYVTGLP